jgi:ABC-type uncharacterized transport system permease subunit
MVDLSAPLVVETPGSEAEQRPRRRLPRAVSDAGTYLIAIVVALAIGGIVLLLIDADPVDAYSTMLRSSLGSTSALALTLNKMTPLLLGAVAVSFAMRAGFLNLGVDGQIYVGAATATGVAFAVGEGVPTVLAVVLVVVAGGIGGALFGLIPAVLRVHYGVNELFVTVMLNFVGFYIVDWLATGPWTDPLAGEAITRSLGFEWRLPRLLEGAHIGILIAIPIAVALSLWLTKTRRGFEFRAAGANPAAARLGGVSLWRTGLVALVVSGAVAGVAGGIELAGVHVRLVSGLSPNYGYMAVLAAVLAKRSPLLAVPVSFGFAVLLVGSDALQGSIGLPSSAVLIFQALVVLSVLFFESLRGGRRPNLVVGKGTR